MSAPETPRRVVEVIQLREGVYLEARSGKMIEVPCQWFGACENHAMTTMDHPVLGSVPICRRCEDKVKRISDARSD